MNPIFSEEIKKRALIKLGEPSITVELEKEAMQALYVNSVKDWTLYSSLSNLDEEKLYKIKQEWIENYFQSLCKESLGRIRGKFLGVVNIPGAEMNLEYESLLSESIQEKESLVGLLVPAAEKIVLVAYINVGNMDDGDVPKYIDIIRKKLSYDKTFKYFFIPIRGEEQGRIECIYPNFVNDKKIKNKLNIILDDIIKNVNDEK